MRNAHQLICSIVLTMILLLASDAYSQNNITKIELADFIVDFNSINGKSVQLDGWLVTMGDTFMLYERAGSMISIYADSSRLSSDEKRFLVSQCGSGCNVSLIGKPSIVMLNKGLNISRLVSPNITPSNKKTGEVDSAIVNTILQMSVPDFIVDYDTLPGKQVQLYGFLLSMGDNIILYEQMGSLNAVFIDASRLSRDERKFILSQCGGGCSIKLLGTPGTVMMNKGLVATKLVN